MPVSIAHSMLILFRAQNNENSLYSRTEEDSSLCEIRTIHSVLFRKIQFQALLTLMWVKIAIMQSIVQCHKFLYVRKFRRSHTDTEEQSQNHRNISLKD